MADTTPHGSLFREALGRWSDLTKEQQERVRKLLTPDPEDNLEDLASRCERALDIIRGVRP